MPRFKGRLAMELTAKRFGAITRIKSVEDIGVHSLRMLKHPSAKAFWRGPKEKSAWSCTEQLAAW